MRTGEAWREERFEDERRRGENMDRYHIYESIGKGKHSVVYKGREKKTIQYYAVKSVEKSQRQRVLQEVHALSDKTRTSVEIRRVV